MKYKYDAKFKYTDNPYIDLLVYNIKLMTLNSIVKNESRALEYESIDSAKYSADMIRYMNGAYNDDSVNYGLDVYDEPNNYYRMLYGLPKIFSIEDRDRYNAIHSEKISLTELNRSMYIPLDQYQYLIPKKIVDLTGRYLHEYNTDNTIITLFESYGVMDAIRAQYTGSDYEYIYHVGERSVDPYTARTAEDYSLLYCPKIEFDEVYYKFKKYYARNRVFTINNIYSEAYTIGSQHYPNFIIILILIQTMIDMVVEVQEYVINKEVFDSRTIRYLFESYGVEYYKEIPVRYQIAMIKNMNNLIKYKSTTKNIIDIANLFGFPNINIFTYYLAKVKKVSRDNFVFYTDYDLNPAFYPDKRCIVYTSMIRNNRFRCRVEVDYGKNIYRWIDKSLAEQLPEYESGVNFSFYLTDTFPTYSDYGDINIVTEDDIGKENFNKNYDLTFIRVPITDQNVDKYMKDKHNRRTYDEITHMDPFWDGVSGSDILTQKDLDRYHEAKRNEILKKEFSVERTKYLSVDASIDLVKTSYQLSYFMNILFDKNIDEETLYLDVDSHMCESGKTRVKLSDLLLLSIALGYIYNGVEPDIVTTSYENNLFINGFNFDSGWIDIYNDINDKNYYKKFHSIEYKLDNNIKMYDRYGKKVSAGKFGNLAEHAAEENPEDSYTSGAFLSGRYKVCTCSVEGLNDVSITTYDERYDEETGELILPDAYESLVWERMQNFPVYDLIGAYFPATTKDGSQREYIWDGLFDEVPEQFNYPAYLDIPIREHNYPLSRLNLINGKFDKLIVPCVNGTGDPGFAKLYRVFMNNNKLYVEPVEDPEEKENNYPLVDPVDGKAYYLKFLVTNAYPQGKLFLVLHESRQDVIEYREIILKDDALKYKWDIFVHNKRLYIDQLPILKYHLIDISWETPYDPEQNSHGNFLNTYALKEIDPEEDDLTRFKKLKEIYSTNTNLYNHLKYMMRKAESKRMFDIYNTVFNSMMQTKVSNDFYILRDEDGVIIYEYHNDTFRHGVRLFGEVYKNIFYNVDNEDEYYDAIYDEENDTYIPDIFGAKPKIADNYYDFLASRDLDLSIILRKAARSFSTEDDKKAYIMKIGEYITYALEKYFDTEEWKYMYSILPGNNIELIQRCIIKVVNFFKSWKTQILDETVIYYIDDKTDNQVRILDDMVLWGNYSLYEKPSPKDYFHDFRISSSMKDTVDIGERVIIHTKQ